MTKAAWQTKARKLREALETTPTASRGKVSLSTAQIDKLSELKEVVMDSKHGRPARLTVKEALISLDEIEATVNTGTKDSKFSRT